MLQKMLLGKVIPGLVAAAALAALAPPLAGATAAAPNSVGMQPAHATVAPGAEVSVTVQAEAPAGGLGSWSLAVGFDPAAVRFAGCSGMSFCNETASGAVALMGFSAVGLSGAQTLATLRFTAAGAAGAGTALDLRVDSFADTYGEETGPAVADGAITVEGAAATPTPAPDGEREALWGDVDCNGGVAIGDAQKLSLSLVGIAVTQTPTCPPIGGAVSVDALPRTWGDVDCSGAITIGDAQKVARSLIGLPVEQGGGCAPLSGTVLVVAR
ncbi:MAG: hypothetical protein Q7T33_08570 [Dehalococcoidia bacterium]|nr:hypothetical protein [Dehalococcoidia bacterium]